MQVFYSMPDGYRWLTDAEYDELWSTHPKDYVGWMNHVAVKKTDIGDNTAGYIVPWDCMIEFGMDHNHDAVECERVLADMNPAHSVSEHYDNYGIKEYY